MTSVFHSPGFNRLAIQFMPKSMLWQHLKSFSIFLKHLVVRYRASLFLVLLGIFLPLQIFGELAEDVWENEGGFPWDQPILLAIHSTASPWLDTVATQATKLGVFWGVFPATVVLSLGLLLRRHWRKLAYLLSTMIGAVLINRTAKVLLHRVRPDLWVSPAPEFDYGFPSGHAMASMAFVAAIAILAQGSRWFASVVILGGVFVILIGWTRLYLGVHYPSDIVAGWAASLAWAVGVRLVIRPHAHQHKLEADHTNP